MHVLQSVRIALEMLRLHKLRAFLTMLGVIIGVMSVTLIVMVSQGFKSFINSQFASLGSDTIFAYYDPFTRIERGETTGSISGLKTEDIEFIMNRSPSLLTGSGYREAGNQTVRSGDVEVKNVQARGVDEQFREIQRNELLEGRGINRDDVETMASVAVISEDLKIRLFKDQSALGKTLQAPGITLEIIGVVARSQVNVGGDNPKSFQIPITTAQKKWLGRGEVDAILFRAKPGANMNAAMDEVWQALMIKSGNKAIYRVDSSENITRVFAGIVGAAGAILVAIAALSLLVGGIGIMNIMLVSVTERTREIGLRKAVGATQGSVLLQFLIEAAMLSLVGGLIGMGLAWMVGNLVTLVTMTQRWPTPEGLATPFPVLAAILSAGFSALIGMVFGFYPAVSASRLDPIVALRRE
ncbi:MAG TPA: ABC transporter permease [Fimbriimonadaceae bacterium]|nr:ABC transporter permease [Fimbriimonadaceae bacterium]